MKIKKTISAILLTVMAASATLPLWAMDLARAETRTDLAVSTYGVSGRGVIIATLDRGIDWKNNDFRNDDGTTRIKYIFDLTDNSGANAPGNTYGAGTIYTEAQINAVRPHFLQPFAMPSECFQQLFRSVPILHIGSRHRQGDHQAERVDQNAAFAYFEFSNSFLENNVKIYISNQCELLQPH